MAKKVAVSALDKTIDDISEVLPVDGKSRLVMIADFPNVAEREGVIDRILDEAKAYGIVRKAVFYTFGPTREDL